MLDTEKIGAFIAEKRRQHGMTQQQLAGRLNISFQAVSKWENGTACPNIELLAELAAVLGVTADELLAGRERAVERKLLHAMAHITGGGIAGNLCRVIPDGLTARIDLSRLRIPAIFRFIREQGGIREDEMLRTFNCGAGLVLVTGREHAEAVKRLVSRQCACYEIGEIVSGQERVRLEGRMSW